MVLGNFVDIKQVMYSFLDFFLDRQHKKSSFLYMQDIKPIIYLDGRWVIGKTYYVQNIKLDIFRHKTV